MLQRGNLSLSSTPSEWSFEQEHHINYDKPADHPASAPLQAKIRRQIVLSVGSHSAASISSLGLAKGLAPSLKCSFKCRDIIPSKESCPPDFTSIESQLSCETASIPLGSDRPRLVCGHPGGT